MVAQSDTRCVALAVALLAASCDRSTSKPVASPAVVPSTLTRASRAPSAPSAAVPSAVTPPPGVQLQALDDRPFELATECGGSCPVSLNALVGDRALALWAAEDGAWVQHFDLARGSARGVPQALGHLTTLINGHPAEPYVFALRGGDAAILGTLADGRVTLARGSEVATRRLAPKVVVAGDPRGVRSLAASETAEGLVLLLLRGVASRDSRAEHPLVDAELHWLDARGEHTRPAMIWKTTFATQARLATCGERLYLAWDSLDGVAVTRTSSRGEGRGEMLLAPPKADVEPFLGPLLCTPSGASLVSAWQNSAEFKLQRKISVAGISATQSLEHSRWSTLALSGDLQHPRFREMPFGAHVTSSGLQLLLNEDAKLSVVLVDPVTEKLANPPGSPKFPQSGSCLPTSDGKRALCIESKTSQRLPECHALVTRLRAALVGNAPPETSSPVAAAAPSAFFLTGGAKIPDPLAPSQKDARAKRSVLRCGEPGWDGLRKAVESFCVDLREKHEAARKHGKRLKPEWELDGYCGKEPSSLLFQATNCSDEPLLCEHSDVSDILSVDRAEFETGAERLKMNVGHCQLWFAGKGDAWQVVDRECGD